MENWTIWLTGAGGTAIITLIGFFIKLWNDNKIKVLAYWEDKLNIWLEDNLLKILINVFQTYTKDIKGTEDWNLDAQNKAIELAYTDLVNNLPNYLIKYAKKLFSNLEVTLKAKLQNFYESHKEQINQIKKEELL